MKLICKVCGLRVTRWLNGWKHASGGGGGVTPKHRRHVPVPIEMPDPDGSEARSVVDMLRQRLDKSTGKA